eukprot:Skav206174  [mRNA]  locus=scaffold3494:124406:139670:+ [translate_table: standard]
MPREVPWEEESERQVLGRVPPNLISYNAVISSCERGHPWHVALEILEQLPGAKLQPDVISYSVLELCASAAISACEKGRQWRAAVAVFGTMLADQVISACENGRQWRQALHVFDAIATARLDPSIISFNATMSACEKAQQWQVALNLFQLIPDFCLEPDVISHHAAIGALEKGGQWQQALSLFHAQPGSASQNASPPRGEWGDMARPEPWRRTGRKAKDEHFLGLGKNVTLEVSLYDDRWMTQGRGIVQLDERAAEDSHGAGQTWKGRFLAIEDDYYEWWVGNTYPYTSLPFHFCARQAHNCREETYYRQPIHVDVFRLLPEDTFASLGWLTDIKKAEAQRRFVAPDPLPAPGGVADPGPAGVGVAAGAGARDPGEVEIGQEGVDGLARALGGTPARDDAGERGEEIRKKKKQRLGEPDLGASQSSKATTLREALAARKAPESSSSALKMGRSAKKKKKKKEKKEKRKEKKKVKELGDKGVSSDSDSSCSSSGSSSSVFRIAALPQGVDKLHRLHQERPGSLANATLQRFQELLERAEPPRAEDVDHYGGPDRPERWTPSSRHSVAASEGHRAVHHSGALESGNVDRAGAAGGGAESLVPPGAEGSAAGVQVGATPVAGSMVKEEANLDTISTRNRRRKREEDPRREGRAPASELRRQPAEPKRKRARKKGEALVNDIPKGGLQYGPLERALAGDTTSEETGMKVDSLMHDPEVVELVTLARWCLHNCENWVRVEYSLFDTIAEVKDHSIDDVKAKLRGLVKFLIDESVPDSHPEVCEYLGVAESSVGVDPRLGEGRLLENINGINVHAAGVEWTGHSGIYVGPPHREFGVSIYQPNFVGQLDKVKVKEALDGQALYVAAKDLEVARQLVHDFDLGARDRISLPQWNQCLWRGVEGGLSLCSAGVVLKLLVEERPGSVGNLSQALHCCALENFPRQTPELLPLPFPEFDVGETKVLDDMKAVIKGQSALGDDSWAKLQRQCSKIGEKVWVWLQVFVVNYLYCQGSGQRMLTECMLHCRKPSKEQQPCLDRLGSLCRKWLCQDDDHAIVATNWEEASEQLGDLYTGPNAIKPTTPGPNEAARVDLSTVVSDGVKPFVEDPLLLLLDEDEVVAPRVNAKVQVTSQQEWDKVVQHLVECGMLEREVESETFHYQGTPVRNGAFGVRKAWVLRDDGTWLRTLRLIINMIPGNSFQKRMPVRASERMGYAPLWGNLYLHDDEIILCAAEDQRHCFHVYRPGYAWRSMFSLNREASGEAFGDGIARRGFPRVKSAPMGWNNIVDFIQDGFEHMAKEAGLVPTKILRMGEPSPLQSLTSPRSTYSFYVDNFDELLMVWQADRGLYEGVPSDAQLKLRAKMEELTVGRDPKKAAEGVVTWSSLGAEVDGELGWVGSAMKFRRALLSSNLGLLSEESVRTDSLNLQSVVSKNMHSVQYCRPLACIFDQLYQDMNVASVRELSEGARDELLLLSCALPQHWQDLRMKTSGQVYATDASPDGGGACVSTQLSPWGAARHVVWHQDITKITEEHVLEWRRRFPKATRVLLTGGWPCINHSQLNVHRGGATAASSRLLDALLQIRTWVLGASKRLKVPEWELMEAYENVVMDEEDYRVQTKKIGFPAVLLDAAQVGRCRRPRLYWLRGIPLLLGVDLTIRKKVRPRGHDYFVDEIRVDTERPPLDWFLEANAVKGDEKDEPFPTFTRPIARQSPPDQPAGLSDCSAKALARWKGDSYRLQPYWYELKNMVTDRNGPRRLLPEEQLRMLGFLSNHLTTKNRLSLDIRGQMIGNSISCMSVARLMAGLVVRPEECSQHDLTLKLWEVWRTKELQVKAEDKPWKVRFASVAPGVSGTVSLRNQILPCPAIPLRPWLDPQGWLSDEEMLTYLLARNGTHRGAEIRIDLGMPFSVGELCRQSVNPSHWLWKVLLSYEWKEKGQHINALELVAVLDLLRRQARLSKFHGQKLVTLVDNQVAISCLTKGRSSSKTLQGPLRRISAVCLTAHFRLCLAWIQSKWNPADGPSRWKKRRSHA